MDAKAKRKATMKVRVYRAKHGRWYDLPRKERIVHWIKNQRDIVAAKWKAFFP